MKTAMFEMLENAFVGARPHEATFTILNLDDGSTAPLGRLQRVAVASKDEAIEWAAANFICLVNNERQGPQ